MLISLLLYALTVIASVFLFILSLVPISPTLPTGVTDAFSWLGTQFGVFAAFFPDGTLPALFSATTAVFTVNLIVLPWIAARNAKLPFAGLNPLK